MTEEIELHPGHFVAIIGGAVAGSEAAARLADRGVHVVVFEQHPCPYGKIDDGLPKWHVKLCAQQRQRIDERLVKPRVWYVPNTRFGDDIHFYDLVHNWGFSAILMANGAWKDRPLPIPGVDRFIGSGLEYQNPLVTWFNHYHDPRYRGRRYEIEDGAMVVGGGLASLDVVKILMLETVLPKLHERGIPMDQLQMEHKGIKAVLDEHGLTLDDLGLQGCTLYYRRRMCDMPLAEIPKDATAERRQKILASREKILRNFQKKFLFKFEECHTPTGFVSERGRLTGLKFKETEIIGGKVVVRGDTEHTVESPLVVSSIGSIPEPVEGIRMAGEVYEIRDPETGRFKGHDNLFGLGNVVTGKGNIKASFVHAGRVADHVVENVLCWREEDYHMLIEASTNKARLQTHELLDFLHDNDILSVEQLESIIRRIKDRQRCVGYDTDYEKWIAEHSSQLFTDEVSRSMVPELEPEVEEAKESV